MTPLNLLTMARAALCVGSVLMLSLLLLPSEALERSIGPGAKLIAFYLFTAGLFAVAPRRRRTDLAALAMGTAGLVQAAQIFLGREAGLGGLLASGLGVAAVFLPGVVEDFRYHVRRNPHRTFRQIREADPRQSARNRTAGSMVRRLLARPWEERAPSAETDIVQR